MNTLVITCSVILTRSFIDVFADDYTYIPIEDIEQYNSYKFWSLYGYQLDYTNSISYTISESGTYTANYHGNLSTNFSGSESSSVNLHISNYTGAGALQNTMSYGGYIAYQPSTSGGIGSEIDITIEADQTNNPTSSAPFVCRATGYSPGTDDWEYNEFTCSTTGGAGYQVFPDYDINVDAFNINNNGIGTFTVDLQNQGSSVGSFSGSLTGSNSGSLNGSISLSGTESTTQHKIYDIPVLNRTTVINPDTSIGQIQTRTSNPYVLAFLSTSLTTSPSQFPYLKDTNNEPIDNTVTKIGSVYRSGYYFYAFEFSYLENSSRYYIDLNLNWRNVIPLYCGTKNNMSDKLYRYIYGSDRTNELIDQGTTQSQNAGQNLNNQTNDFTDASDDLHNFEIDMKENMDDALEDIDVDNAFNFWSTTGPLNSMNWVKLQFDKLIQYDPIKKTLIFSLTLGLALTILGKLRNK